MVQYMDPVSSFSGFPIMHYVCNEVIGSVLMDSLHLLRQVFPEIHVSVAEQEANIRGRLLLDFSL